MIAFVEDHSLPLKSANLFVDDQVRAYHPRSGPLAYRLTFQPGFQLTQSVRYYRVYQQYIKCKNEPHAFSRTKTRAAV
jgi:hypothetical protein